MTTPEPTIVEDDRDDLPCMVHSELDDLGLDPYEFRVYAHISGSSQSMTPTRGQK